MANHFKYKDNFYSIGDTVSIHFKIKEGDKQKNQIFKGILIKIKGNDDVNRMLTIRRISHSGLGVERIFPLNSPLLTDIKLIKKSAYSKAKAYFIRNLTESQIRKKLYS